MRYAPVLLAAFVLCCCCTRQEGSERPEPTPTPTPTATGAPYEVHEWGLLRAAPGDVLEVGAIAPPGRIEPMVVDKPVLYFHATAPVQLESVRVEAVGGTVREHWPLTASETFPASIEWRDLMLDGNEPAGGPRCTGAFPSASERPCSDLPAGDLCESQGLADVVSVSATCVRHADTLRPFLFYRSRTATFTPPLRVRALPSGEIELTNTGDAPIPGWVVRMRRTGGQVQTIAVAAPGARATVTIGTDFANSAAPPADELVDEDDQINGDQPALPGGPEPGRRAVRMTLGAIGLDAGEIDAFMRAWDRALFGDQIVPLVDIPPRPRDAEDGRVTSDGVVLDVLASDRTASADSILYFLPETACDGVSRLTFTPAPTRIVRALAIWQPASR